MPKNKSPKDTEYPEYPLEPLEPVDICGICGEVGEANTFKEVNEEDFIILCPKCQEYRCTVCQFLQSRVQFDDLEYFCTHHENIDNINQHVCDWFENGDDIYGDIDENIDDDDDDDDDKSFEIIEE